MEDTEPAFPRDHVLLRQRNDMYSNQSPSTLNVSSDDVEARRGITEEESVHPAENPRQEGVRVPRPSRKTTSGTADHAQNATPHIRWGRTGVALFGLAALLTGVVTAILAPITAVSWTLPVFAFILGLGAFVSLRYLALADRQAVARPATVPADDRSAEWAEDYEAEQLASTPESTQGLVVKDRESFFNAEGTSSARTEGAPSDRDVKRDSETIAASLPSVQEAPAQTEYDHSENVPFVEEPGLDIETLREQARRVAAGKPIAFTPATSEWSPVELPKPMYIDAPEARRPAPTPAVAPETPQSTSTTVTEAASKGNSSRSQLNLDDVLSRRRA